MNVFSKIRDFIDEILDLFNIFWSFLFSSDETPKKSKEFEASIIIDNKFITKENIPEYLIDDNKFITKENIPEYLSDEDPFEML
jgi:hypothetical protein